MKSLTRTLTVIDSRVRAIGDGLSGPEGVDVSVSVLSVFKVPTGSMMYISWSLENIMMDKQSRRGPEEGPG